MKVKTENIFKFSRKYLNLTAFIGFLCVAILMRLFFLQIVKGDYLFTLSEKNRIRIKRLPPLRGIIYDREQNILAYNIPGFSLYIDRRDIQKNGNNTDSIVGTIAKLTGRDFVSLKKVLEKYKSVPSYVPIKLISNLNWKTLSKIESFSFFLPGVYVDFDPIRSYPYKKCTASVVGYVLEADKNDIKRFKNLLPGDYTGKSGIEKEYNKLLIGKSGKKVVEADAKGMELQVLSQKLPQQGMSLVLNIRKDLQKLAYSLLNERAGVVIAMNPNNGEILCYVSSPSFDPNLFAKGISFSEWKKLINNPLHPLSNRGIGGLYPPGSTFKVITAISGLTNKVVDSKEEVTCNGVYILGDTKYRCWKKYGHGKISIVRAIKESCDVFFYDLGVRVGIDNIYKTGSKFNLGFKTGIDLPGEKKGLLPSKEWKLKAFNSPWYPGETPPVAIGQGYTLVTPLQMLVVYSAIANGGTIYEPRIVNTILNSKGEIVKKFSPKVLRKLNIPLKVLSTVREGLREVVNEIHGTAYSVKINGFEYSGKTGTAQVKKIGEKRVKDINKLPYKERDHAWFVAYAPSEKPVFAVVVLVEHSGHGGSVAAPIAKELIKYYFKLNEKK
jgi:penicillin-binding protein 2